MDSIVRIWKRKLTKDQIDLLNELGSILYNKNGQWYKIEYVFKTTSDPSIFEVYHKDSVPDGTFEKTPTKE